MGLPAQRSVPAEERELKEAERPGGDQAGSKLEGEAAIAPQKEPQIEVGWVGCSWVPPAPQSLLLGFYAREEPPVPCSASHW